MPNTAAGWTGRSIARLEDAALVTGRAHFVADIALPGMLHAAFVRSPIARGRITSIEVARARAASGVVAVITGRDLRGHIGPFLTDLEPTPQSLEASVAPSFVLPDIEVLPQVDVLHVGQPVAMVLADSRYRAEDAAELVDVTYEELPAAVDPEKSLDAGSPRVHESLAGNRQGQYRVQVGDPDRALERAPHSLTLRFRTQRIAASPIECRGVVAQPQPMSDNLTIWCTTQAPHRLRRSIARQLSLSEQQVRVIAPDIGGGFGCKVQIYPEDVLVPYAAALLATPIRWLEDRSEHLLTTGHSRDQIYHVDVGFDDSGLIEAIRADILMDCGVFNPYPLTSAYNPASHFRGPYRVPNFRVDATCVFTNKPSNVPYRGAGRPEAAFAMDRTIYEVARRLHLKPSEVLRQNLIGAAEMPCHRGMPYRDGSEIVYDCGDFRAGFDRLVAECTIASESSKRSGHDDPEYRYHGVGFGSYIEGTGVGPLGSARVQIDSLGRIVVNSGCAPQGQGQRTTISQLVADEFGASPETIIFCSGDTGLVDYGTGTSASRSAVLFGSSAVEAAKRLVARLKAVAGNMLEVDPADLTIDGDGISVRGMPGNGVTLRQLYQAASPGPDTRVPSGVTQGVSEEFYFVPPTVTWGWGFLAAEVAVDIQTGAVEVERFTIVHDCGRILNPAVVEGQIEGGLVQGLGATLHEVVRFDDMGQPLSTTFMDYLLPSAVEAPDIKQVHVDGWSQRNPIGVKGVGESGIIPPPAAIANAIRNALEPLDVDVNELPLSAAPLAAAITRAAPERAEVSRP